MGLFKSYRDHNIRVCGNSLMCLAPFSIPMFILNLKCLKYLLFRLDEELKKHKERARRVNVGQEVLEAKIKVN